MGDEGKASYRAVFADRSFRKLFAAQALSFIGDWLNNIAILVLAYSLTGSPAAAGATLLVKTVPRVLFLLIGGAVADRVDRRRLMVAMDLVRIPLALAPLLVTGRDGLWLLWGSTFLLQVASSFFTPCVVPVVATMFAGRSHLLREANALLSLTVQLAIFIGPILGAAAMALGGMPAAFILNAASFAVSAALLWSLRLAAHEPATSSSGVLSTIPEGLRAVFAVPLLRVLTIGIGAGAAVIYLAQAQLPQLAAALGDSGPAVGLLLAAVGVGAFAGSRLSALPRQVGLPNAAALLVASMVAVSAAFATGSLPLALLLFGLNGLGTTWLELSAAREIQSLREDVQGRASSFYGLLMSAGQVCGAGAAIALDRLDPLAAQLALAIPLGMLTLAVAVRVPRRSSAAPRTAVSGSDGGGQALTIGPSAVRQRAFALVQDALGEGLLILRGDRIVGWNAALCGMSGHDDASLRGLATAVGLIAPEMRQRWTSHLATMRASGHPGRFPCSVRGRDGRIVEVECAAAPIADDGEADTLILVRDLTTSAATERALMHQAVHDGLTELPNRTLFMDRVGQALAGTRRDRSSAALLLMDLDGFKEVNDSFGHDVGDALLRQVSRRLPRLLREVDTIGRLGGDEFAFVLPGVGRDGALMVAERIHAALAPLFVVDARPIRVAASVGIAIGPEHGDDAGTLLRRADLAMYDAKRMRQRSRVYSGTLEARHDERRRLGEEFRSAIEDRQLFVCFQPVVDLKTRRVSAVEALLRWQHPRRGVLAPAEFLPIAQSSGLGTRIDELALREALARCRAWRMAGFSDLPVAVNFGMQLLHEPDLVDRVLGALEEIGLPPGALIVEVTEDAAMSDPGNVIGRLRDLRERGIAIAIDDFGTGYSSLSYLREMPATTMKLDRSFVIDATSAGPRAAIVRSAIALGQDLGLRVVAEGVEDEATAQWLADLGCDQAQGFHYARPLPLHDLIRWLEDSPHGLPAEAQRAHASSFLALAEEVAAEGLGGAQEGTRMQTLDREHHNIGIALDWALRNGDASTAVRLATALRFFWVDRGHVRDGIGILEAALASPEASPRDALRAAGLNALGMLLGQQGALERAQTAFEESIAIHRELGDAAYLARSLNNLGIVASYRADRATAETCYREALELRRASGDTRGQSATLNNLAALACGGGALTEARRLATAALDIAERHDTRTTAEILDTLGAIALARGDLEEAARHYRHSLSLYAELGVTGDDAQPLIGLALIASATGDVLRAATLAGAVGHMRERFGGRRALNEDRYEHMLERLRATVTSDERDAAIGQGRDLSRTEVLDLALGIDPVGRAVRPPAPEPVAVAAGVPEPALSSA